MTGSFEHLWLRTPVDAGDGQIRLGPSFVVVCFVNSLGVVKVVAFTGERESPLR